MEVDYNYSQIIIKKTEHAVTLIVSGHIDVHSDAKQFDSISHKTEIAYNCLIIRLYVTQLHSKNESNSLLNVSEKCCQIQATPLSSIQLKPRPLNLLLL